MALRTAQVDAPGWRTSRRSDDDTIVALCLSLYAEDPGPQPVGAAQVRNTLARLRDEPARGAALVLEVDDRVVGYVLLVSFWSNEAGGVLCTIDELYVEPALRSRGHASALISSLTRGRGPLAEHGVGVSLEVTSANTRALALYQRLGFQLGNRLLRQLIALFLILLPLIARAGPPPSVPEAAHTSLANAVVLVGNQALSEDVLRKAMAEGSSTTLDEAANLVEHAYLVRGYVAVKVTGATDPLSRKPTLSITEGALYALRSCTVLELGLRKKDKLGDSAKVCALLPLHVGDAFTKDEVHTWMSAVRARYASGGVRNVVLTPITLVDSDAHTVGITLEITRQPQRAR